MINWEKLYYMVCEKVSEEGHEHHIIPKHTGLENNDITVKLTFRNHVLAHYIRYKWLHEKGDRKAVQVLTRKNIPKFDDEKEVVYKKKKIKNNIPDIHPKIVIISKPIVIIKKQKMKKLKSNIIPKSKHPGLNKKLKNWLRSQSQIQI